jgi:hypothetical protein
MEILHETCIALYALGKVNEALRSAQITLEMAKAEKSLRALDYSLYLCGIYSCVLGKHSELQGIVRQLECLENEHGIAVFRESKTHLREILFLNFNLPSLSLPRFMELQKSVFGIDNLWIVFNIGQLAIRSGNWELFQKSRRRLHAGKDERVLLNLFIYAPMLEIEERICLRDFSAALDLITHTSRQQIPTELRPLHRFYLKICRFRLGHEMLGLEGDFANPPIGFDFGLGTAAPYYNRLWAGKEIPSLNEIRAQATKAESEGLIHVAAALRILVIDMAVLWHETIAFEEEMPHLLASLSRAEDVYGELLYLTLWEKYLNKDKRKLDKFQRKRRKTLSKHLTVNPHALESLQPFASFLEGRANAPIAFRENGIYLGDRRIETADRIPAQIIQFLSLFQTEFVSRIEISRVIWQENYEPERHDHRINVLVSSARRALNYLGLRSYRLLAIKKVGYALSGKALKSSGRAS